MSISTSPALRCPRCSAHVVAGGDWCTLCYADLRPPSLEPPAPVDSLVETAQAVPSVEQAEVAPASRRGKHARVAAPELGSATVGPAADVEALADQLIAELAAAETKNPLGPLAGMVDTTGKRIALMTGGAAAAIILLVVVMAVTGALL